MYKYLFILISILSGKVAFATDDSSIYEAKLKFLTAKDAVASKNIANSDTPNFLPKTIVDVEPFFKYDVSLFVTDPMHIPFEEKSSKYKFKTGKITEIKPNGNAVNIESEMLDKKTNAMKIEEVANIYKKNKEMLLQTITSMNK